MYFGIDHDTANKQGVALLDKHVAVYLGVLLGDNPNANALPDFTNPAIERPATLNEEQLYAFDVVGIMLGKYDTDDNCIDKNYYLDLLVQAKNTGGKLAFVYGQVPTSDIVLPNAIGGDTMGEVKIVK